VRGPVAFRLDRAATEELDRLWDRLTAVVQVPGPAKEA